MNSKFVVAITVAVWAVLSWRGARPQLRLALPLVAWLTYNFLCGLAFFLATDYPYFLGLIDLSNTSRPINWSAVNTIPADLVH